MQIHSFDYQQRVAGEVMLTVHVGSPYPEATPSGRHWAWACMEESNATIWLPPEALDFTTFSHEAVHVAQCVAKRNRKRTRWIKAAVPCECPSWELGDAAVRNEAVCRIHDDILIRFLLELEMRAPEVQLPFAHSFDLARGTFRLIEETFGGAYA